MLCFCVGHLSGPCWVISSLLRNLFEPLKLLQTLVHTDAQATIVTGLHQIQVYSGNDLVTLLPYALLE